MSQKVTLTDHDKKELLKIKPLLLEGYNQTEIAISIGQRRETVNRRINRWMKTDEFVVWIREVWLHLFGVVLKLDPKEAFRHVTRLMEKTLPTKTEAKIEGKTEIIIKGWGFKEDATRDSDKLPPPR